MAVNRRKISIIALAVSALLLMGIGLWFIYWPAAPIGIGFLVWLDLSITKWRPESLWRRPH